MKNIATNILLVLVAAVIGLGVFLNSTDRKQEMLNASIDNCGKMAYSVKPGEFIQFIYKLCLTDKGYKTTLK